MLFNIPVPVTLESRVASDAAFFFYIENTAFRSSDPYPAKLRIWTLSLGRFSLRFFLLAGATTGLQ